MKVLTEDQGDDEPPPLPPKVCFLHASVLHMYISFIDQACSDKMAGYWPSSFFVFYRPRQSQGP